LGQTSEPGRIGHAIPLPHAKVIGGGSAVNATAALRGHPMDFDGWANRGNPGWAFADVLPVFKRLEHDFDFANDVHGTSGPFPIRRYSPAEWSKEQTAFVAAAEAAGHARVADHNAPGAMGVGPFPMNTIAGVRQSCALTYLAPARSRPNLTVRASTLVDRVVMNGTRATGVKLASGETIAADWVVLSAASYGSPAILMRSGIGPADALRTLRIPVVADRRGVGQNLIEHPDLELVYEATPGAYRTDLVWRDAAPPPLPLFQTLLTLRSTDREERHDLQIFPVEVVPPSNSSPASGTLDISLVRPRSIGRLWLRSAAPTDTPHVDPGFYRDDSDLDRMVEGIRVARRLLGTAPLSGLVVRELAPGPRATRDEELARFVLAKSGTIFPPVGTCRMGPVGDPDAVVDAAGRVHGVEAVSVIDASIMPTITAANTNLTTVMIAERCAALIT
jgi:choline dehydrogenase